MRKYLKHVEAYCVAKEPGNGGNQTGTFFVGMVFDLKQKSFREHCSEVFRFLRNLAMKPMCRVFFWVEQLCDKLFHISI